MATLLIRHPDGSESEQELGGELTIGRAENNDVILAEGGVSRRHARLFVGDAGEVLVEDTGSANGTFIDGLRIDAPTELKPRSQLVIGDYEISVKAGASAKPRPAQPPRRPPAGNGAALGPKPPTTMQKVVPSKALPPTKVVPAAKRPGEGAALAKRARPGAGASEPALRGLTGPWANKLFPLRGKVVVGRVPGVQIQLEDDSVSRRHAEIEVTASGAVLRDLGSANGTLVNGQPVEGDVPIQTGDILQFGVVEMTLEGESLKAPTRRDAQGRRVVTGARDAIGDPRKKRLAIIGGSVGALLVLLVIVKLATGHHDYQPPPPTQPDPEKDIQALLSECRSYTAPDFVTEPDWGKAEIACGKALDLDPINVEANSLTKKIKLEKQMAEHYAKGQKAMRRLNEEEAIDEFKRITPQSVYYPRVKTQIGEALDGAKKRAADDCRQFSSEQFWQQATVRCGRYMELACQTMEPTELYPPPGFTIKPGGRARKHEWWPKDPMYQRFLTARSHDADPKNSEPWQCPYIPIFHTETVDTSPATEARKAIEKRFPDHGVALAVMNYWTGKTPEAILALQRIREDSEKVPLYAQVDQLKLLIFQAKGVYEAGESALQKDDLDQAAEYFHEVLDTDQKLMLDQADLHPSFYRQTIKKDVAAKAYELGKNWMDREDARRACHLWKLGFAFSKANTDLNRAVTNICTQFASRKLTGAQTCADLAQVLDYAVDGDGIKEQVDAQKAQMNCPK